ncbi:MAG: glycosyltransferase family 4 protein [Candidatus Peribacteraceae bacterium]|nr:glycosyltransferase family 4 protein [Candidatus Peribacteraceae bacterium]
MKIGVFSYDFDPPIGGLGRSVKALFDAMKQRYTDHEFLVFSPSSNSAKNVPKIARFWWKKKGGCPMFSLSLYFALSRLIKRHQIDIMHVHSGSGGVFVLRKPACRLIVTSHHTYRQEMNIVFKPNTPRYWWKGLMAKLEQRTYMLADKIICVSDDTKLALAMLYGIPAHKLCVIENSIDFGPLAPDQSVQKDGNTITFLGRLEERKGIWTLLKAFVKLARKYPRLKLRLAGENLIGQKLERFVQCNGLQDSVVFLGKLYDPLFRKEMKAATVVVIPSLIEGFGLVAAETMAVGTIVVASNSEGLRSIIKHGKTGLLFKTNDADHCAATIEQALLRSDERAIIERQAMKEARERFTIERQAQQTMECYEQFMIRGLE